LLSVTHGETSVLDFDRFDPCASSARELGFRTAASRAQRQMAGGKIRGSAFGASRGYVIELKFEARAVGECSARAGNEVRLDTGTIQRLGIGDPSMNRAHAPRASLMGDFEHSLEQSHG
jgi:hypothetical protein